MSNVLREVQSRIRNVTYSGRKTRSVHNSKNQVNKVIDFVVISLLVTLREGVLVGVGVEAIGLSNRQSGNGLVLGVKNSLVSKALDPLI
jgi:hypothetical protein